MSKKLERLLNKEHDLREFARFHQLYCTRHQKYLDVYEVSDRRCYLKSKERAYCKYAKIRL